MKRLLFVLWAVAMWQIAVWTFFPAKTETAAVAPAERNYGKAHSDNEPVIARGREFQRADALKLLEQPTAVLCSPEGRRKVASGLSEYFFHRRNQTLRYSENFGTPGAEYIARQWSTADDQRIDRLVREAYSSGYITPDELTKGYARDMLISVTNGIRITGKGCAA